MIRFLFVLLLIWNLHVDPAAATSEFTKFAAPDKNGVISVKFHVSSITSIDTQAETWSGAGYLIYSWDDENVVNGEYGISEHWHPALELVNLSEVNVIGSTVTAKNGKMTAQERITFTLSTAFDLHAFPFDEQTLELHTESIQFPDLQLQNGGFTISDDRFTSLSEWNVSPSRTLITSSNFAPEGVNYSRLSFYIKAVRNPNFYVNKIIVPVTVLTLASFLAFVLPLAEFGTQISIALTTLLSSLTLWLLSSDSLAKTSYSSYLDEYVFVSLAVNGLVLVVAVLLHRMIKKRFGGATLLFKSCRIMFPISYAAALLWFTR